MLQSNPSDATHNFIQPDWNSEYGNGISVPADRDVSRSLDDIYDSQRSGAKIRAGVDIGDPTISSLSPATGPAAGGTVVTVNGNNFMGASGVTFGGAAGTAMKVETDNRIKVTTPAGTVGAKDVVVTTASGTATSTGGFTYA
jgi:IPT/TIG domain